MGNKKIRANGTGSLYWVESRKRYVASYFDPYGKRVSKSFKTREEASDFLETQIVSMENKLYVEVPSENITLAEWITEYLITYKKKYVSAQTYQAYVNAVIRMKPVLGLKLKKRTNVFPLQKFFNDCMDLYSFSTINVMKTVLMQSIRKAYDLHMISENYANKLEIHPLRKSLKRRVVKVFTIEQLNMLKEAYHSYYVKQSRGMSQYVIFMIALYSGMRVGEILALQWKDIDLVAGRIQVSKTLITLHDKSSIQDCPKSESSFRTISIPHELIDLLGDYKKRCQEKFSSGKIIFLDDSDSSLAVSFLFRNFKGEFFPYSSVRLMFTKVCKRLHIEHFTFHSLRHTFASYLLANGVPITVVSHVLGHRSSNITLSIYSHFVPQSDSLIVSTSSHMYDKNFDEIVRDVSSF